MTEEHYNNIAKMSMAIRDYIEAVSEDEDEVSQLSITTAGFFLVAAQNKEDGFYSFDEDDLLRTAALAVGEILTRSECDG